MKLLQSAVHNNAAQSAQVPSVAPVSITHAHHCRLFVNLTRHNVRNNFFANRLVIKVNKISSGGPEQIFDW